jgi:dehydrogenase/reductase SDR family member 12
MTRARGRATNVNYQQMKKVAAFYGRFTLSYTQIGYRARSLTWPALKPDFSGQHWLVTGASGGLGRHIALSAAGAGATVTAAARSNGKLAQLIADAKPAGAGSVQAAVCDFSLQEDTARLVQRLADSGRRIDVLVNNVGVLNDDHSLTREGREPSFTINLLSHYLLTQGLIRRSVLAGPGALVINMTSGGGYNVPLGTTMLNTVDPSRFNGTAAYGFHKRAQMTLNQYWREKYADRGITFHVMHPGWADTDGVKRSLPRFREMLKSVLRDAASGADTAVWLAATRPTQPAGEHVWFDRKPRTTHVYERTRVTRETPQSLVDFLERELARFPQSLP